MFRREKFIFNRLFQNQNDAKPQEFYARSFAHLLDIFLTYVDVWQRISTVMAFYILFLNHIAKEMLRIV